MDSKITLPEPISIDGPEVNVPLLRKAVEWAEAEAAKPDAESEWWQRDYFIDGAALGRSCGTAFCIAGYIANALTGWPKGDGYSGHAANIAREALGLTDDEAHTSEGGLFNGGNSIDDVREIASRIAARAGERL